MSSGGSGIDRRDFLKATSAAGLGLVAGSRAVAPMFATGKQRSANEKVVCAVIGVNGRGVVLAQNFAKFQDSTWAREFARAVSCALNRPYVHVDVATMAVSF